MIYATYISKLNGAEAGIATMVIIVDRRQIVYMRLKKNRSNAITVHLGEYRLVEISLVGCAK